MNIVRVKKFINEIKPDGVRIFLISILTPIFRVQKERVALRIEVLVEQNAPAGFYFVIIFKKLGGVDTSLYTLY